MLSLRQTTLSYVSIHAPWEGCDVCKLSIADKRFVSIHAPWEGCDNDNINEGLALLAFQFTHPGKGATGESLPEMTIGERFQFTHPGKGATSGSVLSTDSVTVSIHAPWEGCDTEGSIY